MISRPDIIFWRIGGSDIVLRSLPNRHDLLEARGQAVDSLRRHCVQVADDRRLDADQRVTVRVEDDEVERGAAH